LVENVVITICTVYVRVAEQLRLWLQTMMSSQVVWFWITSLWKETMYI